MREIKDLNKCRCIISSWIKRNNFIKIAVFLKLTNRISIKIPAEFLVITDNSRTYMKMQKT